MKKQKKINYIQLLNQIFWGIFMSFNVLIIIYKASNSDLVYAKWFVIIAVPVIFNITYRVSTRIIDELCGTN